jgi:hypothetical protein
MKLKYFLIILCIGLVLITINSAFAADTFIMPVVYNSTVEASETFYVHDFSEIENVLNSEKLRNWLTQYAKIDPNNFVLTMVSGNSDEKNVIMISNGTHKCFYSATPLDESILEVSESHLSDGSLLSGYLDVNENQNRFRIVNQCGKTANFISVAYSSYIGPIAVKTARSERYDLPNGGVLNYNPGPEFSTVSIAINVNKKWIIDPTYDIYKPVLPLKTWHTATIKKGSGYYLYFS